MFGGLGIIEILIIALVLVLLFGGKKIQDFIRGIVKGSKGDKKPSSEDEEKKEEKEKPEA